MLVRRPLGKVAQEAVLHLRRGGLGVGQAQDRFRFEPCKQEPRARAGPEPRSCRCRRWPTPRPRRAGSEARAWLASASGGSGARGRSSEILLGLLRQPLLDAGEVFILVVIVEPGGRPAPTGASPRRALPGRHSALTSAVSFRPRLAGENVGSGLARLALFAAFVAARGDECRRARSRRACRDRRSRPPRRSGLREEVAARRVRRHGFCTGGLPVL